VIPKSKDGAAVTVKLKVVVLVTVLLVPVTVTVLVPTVADPLAVKVSVDEQVGLHDVGEKAAVTPVGKPEAVKVTLEVDPVLRVEVMELVTF